MNLSKIDINSLQNILLQFGEHLYQYFFQIENREPLNTLDSTMLMIVLVMTLISLRGAIHVIRHKEYLPLNKLRDKVKQSEDTIDFLGRTIQVINDVRHNNITAQGYERIRQDRIGAQNLLNYLNRKEECERAERQAEEQAKLNALNADQETNQSGKAIPRVSSSRRGTIRKRIPSSSPISSPPSTPTNRRNVRSVSFTLPRVGSTSFH